MTLSAHPLFLILWIAIVFIQGYVLALLIGRKAYRQYPAFTWFIGFCVMQSAVMFYIAYRVPSLYAPVAWASYAPQLVLLITLVMEVFRVVFHPYDTLPKGTVTHFLEATIAVAIGAIAFAMWSPGEQPTGWMTFARAMDQATAQVLCAIFAMIALFSGYFGIPWRHRVYGIGVGFLFYLAVDVVVTTVVAQYKLPEYSAVWPLDMLAFLIACLIWAYYFATPEVPRAVPTLEQLRRVHTALGCLAVHLDPQWQNRSGASENAPGDFSARDRDYRDAADPDFLVGSGKDVHHA